MSQLKHRLVVIGVALAIGTVGAVAMAFLLAALSSCLLRTPLDATDPANWFFWVIGIGIGVGSWVSSFYWGRRRWKLDFMPGESLKLIVVRSAITGAFIGVGVGAVWFELGQMCLALAILILHGPLGG